MSKLVKKDPPLTRVRSAGRISKNLEGLADMYRSKYPDRDVRWVYDPKHKPELSNVTGRQVEGYELVFGKEFEEFGLRLPAEESARHGDLVLMSATTKLREELAEERLAAAREDLNSIDRNFYEQIESMEAPSRDPKHKPRPRGTSTIEERTVSFEYTQREE